MNKEQKNTLEEYAQLKIQIKALEEKASDLNPKVLDILQDNDLGEVKVGELGVLTVGKRRTWIYSPATMNLEALYKDKKKEEERLGVANYTEKPYVLFK
jgi:hypothetical protein